MSSTPGGLVGFTGLYRRERATKYGDGFGRQVCPSYAQSAEEHPYFLHVEQYFCGPNAAETTSQAHL